MNCPMIQDVTGDDREERKTTQIPWLRRELIQLGFRPVGFVKTPSFVGKPTRVVEILRSPYRESFAILELLDHRVHFTFQTLLSDGAIIETSLPFENWTQYILGPLGFYNEKIGYYFKNFHLATFSPAPLGQMWNNHRCRVAVLSLERATPALAQDSISIYTALIQRYCQIRKISSLFFFSIPLLLIFLGILAGPLVLVGLVVVLPLLQIWIAPLLASQIPWPRLSREKSLESQEIREIG